MSYSTSTLRYHSFSLPAATPNLYFAPAPSIPFLFSRRPLMPYRARSVSLKRSPDWKTNLSPATSFPVAHIQLASTRVLCFLLSSSNIVKHTELPLMVPLLSHLTVFPSRSLQLISCGIINYTICLKNWFHYGCHVLKLQNCLVLKLKYFLLQIIILLQSKKEYLSYFQLIH